jgi:ankyrin repeat protein
MLRLTEEKRDELVDIAIRNNASAMHSFLRLLPPGCNIDRIGICGSTPVFHAAIHGCRRSLLLLLDYGADKDKPDFNGMSPLIAAIFNEHYDCAFLLLRRKADTNVGMMYGVTCLHIAVDKAIQNGCDLVVELLHRGADVDKADFFHHTALMRAATKGDMATARILVAAGADPDITEPKFGETAAQIAAYNEHHEVAEFLTHEGNWRRRKNLMMVCDSIAEVESDAKMYKVMQSRDMIGVIFSFL